MAERGGEREREVGGEGERRRGRKERQRRMMEKRDKPGKEGDGESAWKEKNGRGSWATEKRGRDETKTVGLEEEEGAVGNSGRRKTGGGRTSKVDK